MTNIRVGQRWQDSQKPERIVVIAGVNDEDGWRRIGYRNEPTESIPKQRLVCMRTPAFLGRFRLLPEEQQ